MQDYPRTAEEMALAIEDLRESARFLHGQASLLLSFITSSPETHAGFWAHVKGIAALRDRPDLDSMVSVARLLESARDPEPAPPRSAAHDSELDLASGNIVAFPLRPRDPA
jgi:hypothetical protein